MRGLVRPGHAELLQPFGRLNWLDQRLRRINWYPIAAVLFGLPLIAPFWQSGIPIVADSENHFHRIVSVLVNFENGYLWPRWTPYLAGGYGYPLHNFHPPGTYILEALIYLLTHANITAIFMGTQFVITLLYPLGAYCFARTFAGRPGALVAAAAFVYAPMRFRELWLQEDIPQFLAMMLIPWLLWAIARTAQHKSRGWAAITGIILAALVLSHHATTYLAAPLVGVTMLFLIYDQYRTHGPHAARRAFIAVSGGLALGVALSAVYWLPALTELSYTQISTIQGPTYDPLQNFISFSQLLSGTMPVDRALLNWTLPDGVEGARVGVPQLVGMALGLLALLPAFRCSFRVRGYVIIGLIGTAIGLFMMTSASADLWRIIPFARLIQFPMRIMADVGVLVLPGAALLPSLVPSRFRLWLAGGLILIFFGTALPLLYAPITFKQVSSPTPATEIIHEQQTGDIGTTTANEYLPRWVTTFPTIGLQTDSLRNQATDALQTFSWNVWIDDSNLPANTLIKTEPPLQAGSSRYEVRAPKAFTMQFHQLYFPGWQVTIDGTDAVLGQSQPNGLITVPMNAGEHQVTITYAGTRIQHTADAISLIALFMTAGLLLTGRALFKFKAIALHFVQRPSAIQRLPLLVALGITVFMVLNQLVILPSTDWFRPRSALPNVAAQFHTDNVIFGGILQLMGYDIDSSTVSPGQTVQIRLYWRVLQKTDVTLSGAVTLTSTDEKQSWGQAQAFNLGGDVNTHDWPPNDYYAVNEYTIPVAANAPPFLAVVRVNVFPQVLPGTVGGNTPLQYWTTADGANNYALTTLHIAGDYKSLAADQLQTTNVDFDGALKLIGYQLSTDATGQTCLGLRWQKNGGSLADNQVMIHFADGQGKLLGTADSPPLNGLYPMSAWHNGQTLDDVHCFSAPSGTSAIDLGLYSLSNGVRLPAKDSTGQPLPDDSLQINAKAP